MQSYVLCSILCSLHGELVSDPASGLDLWAMADNDSAMGFEQLVPIEEDSGEIRTYYQYKGPCPCKNGCEKAAWPKLKPKLWSYHDPNAIIARIQNHLTSSTWHQMNDMAAANAVNEHLEQHEDHMTVEDETFEMRQAMRDWVQTQKDAKATNKNNDNNFDRVAHAAEIVESTQGFDEEGGTRAMTTMLKEAFSAIKREKAKGNTASEDAGDVLSLVNMLAGVDIENLPGGAKLSLKRKLKSNPLANKKAKDLRIEFSLDELKTVGHILIRSKSQARTLAHEARMLCDTATHIAKSVASTEALIDDCQQDLMRCIESALAKQS